MSKKFKLTNNTKVFLGKTLYQIEALISFEIHGFKVNKGDLGGYVDSEDCLCQDDRSWIFDNSIVDNSRVYNSSVRNNSRVCNSLVDSSCVFNNSCVYNNSSVYNSSVDNSRVYNSSVRNNSRVCNNSSVYNSRVSNSSVRNNSRVCNSCVDNSSVYNNSIVYNSCVYNNSSVDNSCVKKDTFSLTINKYRFTLTDNHIKWGCKKESIGYWLNLSKKEFMAMDEATDSVWLQFKAVRALIKQICIDTGRDYE